MSKVIFSDNSNQNAESKTIIPTTTDENATTEPKNILPNANAGKNPIAVEGSQVFLMAPRVRIGMV